MFVYKWTVPQGLNYKSFSWLSLLLPQACLALTLNSNFIFFLHHNIVSFHWCSSNYNSNTHFLQELIITKMYREKFIIINQQYTLVIVCSPMSPILKPLGSRLTTWYHSILFSLLIQIYIKMNIHTHKNLLFFPHEIILFDNVWSCTSVDINLILLFQVSLLIHPSIESHIFYNCT